MQICEEASGDDLMDGGGGVKDDFSLTLSRIVGRGEEEGQTGDKIGRSRRRRNNWGGKTAEGKTFSG